MGGQVWPVIMQDLEDLFITDDDDELYYDEAAFLEAIGSGKSFKVSIIFSYLIYRLLCLQSPQKHYGLAAGSKIAFVNMAPSATTAKDIVFSEIKTRIDYSPWFRKYYPPNPRVTSKLLFDHIAEDEAGKPLEPYTGQKNIAVIPGNSSKNMAIGYNVFGGVVDEAAFFETQENIGRGSAENVGELGMRLSRRVKSRFGTAGLMIYISSANYAGDFIEGKVEESHKYKRTFGRRRALWESKPPGAYSNETFLFDTTKLKIVTLKEKGKDTIEIPADFLDDFIKNPSKALRDFGSMGSEAINPFMDKEAVLAIMDKATVKHPITRESEMGYPLEWAEWFKPVSYWVAIHIDLSKSRDACGLSMGGWDPVRKRPVWHLIHQIRASKRNNLDYSRVRQMVLDLKLMGWKIWIVSYDNFQSVDSRQILEKKGLDTEYLSCDKNLEPYETLQSYTNTGEADYYHHEILERELRRLELVNGIKVDHPPGGTKDVADGVAGVAYWMPTLKDQAHDLVHAVVVNRPGRRHPIIHQAKRSD